MDFDTVYARNEQVVSRRIAGELILVPIRQSVADLEALYVPNEVGARIYELIDGARTVRDIVDAIVAEFEVTPETAEADVREFVAQLLEIRGIKEISSSR
jgi:hypothetical protein